MAPDEEGRKDAERLIREANRALARLQRQRLETLSGQCLPLYNHLERSRPTSGSPFAVDSSLMQLLSTSFDERDFSESARAEELDRAAESFAQQLRLYRKRALAEFDVFLCHNSEDKPEVRSIAAQLRRRGYLPWLDEDEIQPGTTWQSKIQADIERIKSCAVIVGPSGIGPWQTREVDAALQLFVEKRVPIIPVLLPSSGTVPDLPIFLRSFGWVDYRTLDPDPFERLVWGITGKRWAI